MRRAFALVACLVLAVPAAGQTPLTVAAALDEAVKANADLAALRLDAAVDRSSATRRASRILADVRRAHARLAIARDALAVHEEIWLMSQDMAVAGARNTNDAMGRHDQAGMVLEMARVGLDRSRAQQQVKVAEYRLNELLGRRIDAAVEPLAPRADTPIDPPDVSRAATPRDARRLLQAWARVEGARERGRIMTSTVLPQATLGFDAARAAYATGHGTFVDTVAAHHRLFEVRLEHEAIQADETRALVALEIALGETPERLARAIGGPGGT